MATPVFYLFSDRFSTRFLMKSHFWTPRKPPPGTPPRSTKNRSPDPPEPPKSKKGSKNTPAKTTYDEKVVLFKATPEKVEKTPPLKRLRTKKWVDFWSGRSKSGFFSVLEVKKWVLEVKKGSKNTPAKTPYDAKTSVSFRRVI